MSAILRICEKLIQKSVLFQQININANSERRLHIIIHLLKNIELMRREKVASNLQLVIYLYQYRQHLFILFS